MFATHGGYEFYTGFVFRKTRGSDGLSRIEGSKKSTNSIVENELEVSILSKLGDNYSYYRTFLFPTVEKISYSISSERTGTFSVSGDTPILCGSGEYILAKNLNTYCSINCLKDSHSEGLGTTKAKVTPSNRIARFAPFSCPGPNSIFINNVIVGDINIAKQLGANQFENDIVNVVKEEKGAKKASDAITSYMKTVKFKFIGNTMTTSNEIHYFPYTNE